MTLSVINPGVNTTFSTKLNNNFAETLILGGLNLARQLKDRTITYSSSQLDFWGDSFTSSTGRMSTVNAGSTTATFTTDAYLVPSGTSPLVVVMNIPASTFSATISKAIGVPHIKNWETGANIEYKLTNGSEDSGWLTCGNTPTISSFTAFTSQPTTLTIRLTPKSSSPTANYPAIYGFVVRAS